MHVLTLNIALEVSHDVAPWIRIAQEGQAELGMPGNELTAMSEDSDINSSYKLAEITFYK